MARRDWDPLGILVQAATTTMGWIAVVMTVSALGVWCGCCVADGMIAPPLRVLGGLVLMPMIVAIYPPMLIACAVTVIAIYLPVHYESRWLYAGAAIASFSAWAGMTIKLVEFWDTIPGV